LRIVTDDIVIVNIVFRVEIAGRRRMPVRIQRFTYLFFLHGVPPDTVRINLSCTLQTTPQLTVLTTSLKQHGQW
jgi:hypothetical protein